MEYEEWKRVKDTKMLGQRVTDKISSGKGVTLSEFFDLTTELTEFDKEQEKARKNGLKGAKGGQSAFERAYNAHNGYSEGPVKPPVSIPDPNVAFRRKKGNKSAVFDSNQALKELRSTGKHIVEKEHPGKEIDADIERIEWEDEYIEYKGRSYKKMRSMPADEAEKRIEESKKRIKSLESDSKTDDSKHTIEDLWLGDDDDLWDEDETNQV